jgi:SNF2 family DNA or RNA helicase
MVSITTAGTVDEHLDDMKRQKAKHIKAVMDKTEKLSKEELLKMFDPIGKTNETVWSDSEDD